MKKIYTLVAVAMSAVTLANAQRVVTEDYTIEYPWDLSDEYISGGLTLVGATATISQFSLNAAGLPMSYARSGEWQPVTLSNGGVVKFYDAPENKYPNEDLFNSTEANADIDYEWDGVAGYLNTDSVYDNDWVIEGTGNEIYLDSYCTFGGTITGSGEVTIYVGSKTSFNFTCGIFQNKDTSSFVGTIFVKPLNGYKVDTIHVGTKFSPGWPAGGNGYMITKQYAGCSTVIDLTGFGGDIVWDQSGANSLCYPPVRGKGVICTGNMPYFNGLDGETFEYDATIELAGSEGTHDFEVYGGSQAFNAPINGNQRFFYVRSDAQVYFNSPTPSCSDFREGISQRSTGITGGTGWADFGYTPSDIRANLLSAGYPYNTVGQMTWKNIWVYIANIVQYDFDNAGHADVLNVTGNYTMYEGQNQIRIGLPDNFQPKAGKYRVINGNIDAGLATYVDTIGYEVWDNNGPAYVIRSVKGGEIVKLADGSNDEYVAQPGDSIGAAGFADLATKYGATVMDGNRPYYLITNWGAGTFSNGEPTDGSYKNTEDPKLYTPNPAQIGTGASDPDSTKWQAVWEQFLADHPVSDAWVAVTPDDPSVIPGTVTDSIFLTYSHYHASEGTIAGDHDWSYKNGSGASSTTKGYPYANPITFAYYYYSNNSVRLQAGTVSNYLNGADTTEVVSFAQQSFPIYLTQNHDSVLVSTEDVFDEDGETVIGKKENWTFVTDTIGKRFYTDWSIKVGANNGNAGDSIQYRFNFKNYISDGIIAIETLLTKANGETEETLPAEDDVEEIVNAGDIQSIGTLVKENSIVKTREYFNLAGQRVNNVANGVSIVRTVYTDGTVKTRRIVIR